MTRRGSTFRNVTTAQQDGVSVGSRAYGVILSTERGVSMHLLPATGTRVFGRGEECDVAVLDRSVSRRHVILHAGDPPQLEDLGSRNGTRVAGVPLESGARVRVGVGTVVEIGSATMVVQWAERLGVLSKGTPAKRQLRDGVVAENPLMLRLFQLVDVIAPSKVGVLLLGETGVGKEVFAEAVHAASTRAKEPFLRLNCAAIPESVLESELFGHERGAFTGAFESKAGLFESADGGTVFLDEVGELTPATQAKLLRVLENGEVMRVGGRQTKRVDVRFIAATNRDLEARVAAETFRADLFYRLNGITLTIPPLRERPEDVAPLAERFVSAACRAADRAPLPIDDTAIDALKAHAWPGNVRELKSVMERAVLVCDGGGITEAHVVLADGGRLSPRRLPEASVPIFDSGMFRARTTLAPPPPPTGVRPVAEHGEGVRQELDRIERERVAAAMEEAAGNQTRAARILGISRWALIRRLEEYGAPRPRKK